MSHKPVPGYKLPWVKYGKWYHKHPYVIPAIVVLILAINPFSLTLRVLGDSGTVAIVCVLVVLLAIAGYMGVSKIIGSKKTWLLPTFWGIIITVIIALILWKMP